MDSSRNLLINKCYDRINELKIYMKNDEDMINGIKNLGNTAYTRAQIAKADTKKEERLKELAELDYKIINIPNGLFDDDIISEKNKIIKEQEDKKRVRDEKRKDDKEYKMEKSKQSTAFYESTRLSDRAHRYEDKDMQRGYNYFVKSCNSIPDYILNNLKNMPGNKGYFWKNIACYGELPREKGQPTTLFEKRGGGLLIIHEWTPTEYNIYHKNDKDRKRLFSSEKRKKLR